MERSESEPDSAGRWGERANKRDAQFTSDNVRCLGTSSLSGNQSENWGSLISISLSESSFRGRTLTGTTTSVESSMDEVEMSGGGNP